MPGRIINEPLEVPGLPKKAMERVAERLVLVEHEGAIMGKWKPVLFNHLEPGDIFRLWDVEEDGARCPDTPEQTNQVCVCLTKPKPHVNENEVDTMLVQSLGVRLFHSLEVLT